MMRPLIRTTWSCTEMLTLLFFFFFFFFFFVSFYECVHFYYLFNIFWKVVLCLALYTEEENLQTVVVI